MKKGIIKSETAINIRRFPVLARDNRTGAEESVTVTVTKQQLQASGFIGQSSKELIERICTRQGYTVLDIGTPDKLAVTVDLDELCGGQTGKRERGGSLSDCTKESMKSLKKAIAIMEDAEQVRKAKREEMERLTMDLLAFDNECLGAALKCYISEDTDATWLTDAAYGAYDIISKIKVLEWEC